MSNERLDFSDPFKLQTRDGLKVLWVADSGLEVDFPVVAYLNGLSTAACYTPSGRYHLSGDSPLDLVYAPVKREGWIVSGVNCVCMPDQCLLVTSRDSADRLARLHGGKVIRIEWEE